MERKRRYSNPDSEDRSKKPRLGFDPNCQLRLLTEIKKCVNENNNLIKKRLDSVSNGDANDDSIKVLAEKNFSELNRLSKMADNSVKLFKVPNSRKRDLTPGFDSENIKKPSIQIQQPYQDYPKIRIPSISKIISLKTTQECAPATSTQATSMDEPQNSAAGVTEMLQETSPPRRSMDMSCQADVPPWSDVEAMMKSYKDYDAGNLITSISNTISEKNLVSVMDLLSYKDVKYIDLFYPFLKRRRFSVWLVFLKLVSLQKI